MKAKYLGLDLSSPVVVSSSPYTATVANIGQCVANGAGAVVLKSIFEEQIIRHAAALDYPSQGMGDSGEYLERYLGDAYKGEFLKLVSDARTTGVPVIASINCIAADDGWTDYAVAMEAAGAAALELNIFLQPTDRHRTAQELEQDYADVLRPWIGVIDPETGKGLKHPFRRDPRDISAIWFFDPELKEYFKIPLADPNFPSCSIWELKRAKQELKDAGFDPTDSKAVLRSITERRQLTKDSAAKTKLARKAAQRLADHQRVADEGPALMQVPKGRASADRDMVARPSAVSRETSLLPAACSIRHFWQRATPNCRCMSSVPTRVSAQRSTAQLTCRLRTVRCT